MLNLVLRPRGCACLMIWIRISDPIVIKGTDESVTRVDSSVPLMHHDPSDLGSLILIQITSKECTLVIKCIHLGLAHAC